MLKKITAPPPSSIGKKTKKGADPIKKELFSQPDEEWQERLTYY
jgi:hypothetical protein